MAKYIIDIPDEVPVSDELVPFDMCRPSWYWEAYEKGKADTEDNVWEFAMKCLSMDGNEFCDVFDSCDALCLTNYSYQAAKAKYDSWRKRKDEVCVGDEVTEKSGLWKGIVMNIDDTDDLTIMDSSGKSCNGYKKKHFRKTGNHFNEIAELLKKMSEE